jgi:hypothetical protein
VTSPGFSLEARSEVQDRTLTLTYRYRSLRESLPANDTRRHLADVDRAEDVLGYSISNARRAGLASPRAGSGDSAAYGGLVLLGLALAGGGTMAFQAFRARARRRAFKIAAILPEGDSPASALVVADDAALARALEGRACSCGARGSLREAERHGLSFDRQSMLALTTHCGACGRDHTVYARLTAGPPSTEVPGRAAGTVPLED